VRACVHMRAPAWLQIQSIRVVCVRVCAGRQAGRRAGRRAGGEEGRQAGRRAGRGVSSGTRWQQVYLGPHPAPVATVPGPVCGMGSARVRGPSPSVSRSHVGLVCQCPIHSQMTAGCDRVGVWADVKHRKERDCKCGTCYSWGQPASRRPNTPRSSVCHHLTIGLGVSSPDTQPNNWRRCATGWMCMVDVTQRNGEIGGWGECERAAFGYRSWDIVHTKDTKEVGGGGRFSLLPAVGWRNQLSGMHVRSNAATWGRQGRGARCCFFTPCLPSRQRVLTRPVGAMWVRTEKSSCFRTG